MIHRENGEFICECSECGMEEFGGTLDDFREFVQQLKDTDWRIRKDDESGEWLHICPDCVRAMLYE